MTHAQDTTQAQAALLRNDSGITTPVTDCGCEAASIIAPLSATTEGLVPHEKLREAAIPEASLIALNRPPAQLAKGYTYPTSTAGSRAGGPRYWPADLTNVHPDEWAQMSPKHVAEFAGMTEVWLLLEAAQKHIAQLQVDKQNLQADNRLMSRNALRYQVLRQADIDTIHNGGLFAGLTPENVVINGHDLDERCDAVIAELSALLSAIKTVTP